MPNTADVKAHQDEPPLRIQTHNIRTTCTLLSNSGLFSIDNKSAIHPSMHSTSTAIIPNELHPLHTTCASQVDDHNYDQILGLTFRDHRMSRNTIKLHFPSSNSLQNAHQDKLPQHKTLLKLHKTQTKSHKPYTALKEPFRTPTNAK
jgi:hypothetical protein